MSLLFDVWLVMHAMTSLIDEALSDTGLSGDDFGALLAPAPVRADHPVADQPMERDAPDHRVGCAQAARRPWPRSTTPNPDDGRSYLIALTPAGVAAHTAAAPRFLAAMSRLGDELRPTEDTSGPRSSASTRPSAPSWTSTPAPTTSAPTRPTTTRRRGAPPPLPRTAPAGGAGGPGPPVRRLPPHPDDLTGEQTRRGRSDAQPPDNSPPQHASIRTPSPPPSSSSAGPVPSPACRSPSPTPTVSCSPTASAPPTSRPVGRRRPRPPTSGSRSPRWPPRPPRCAWSTRAGSTSTPRSLTSCPASAHPDAVSQPRVRHLLDHTAGFANPLPLRWIRPAGAPATPSAEVLARLLDRHGRPRREVGGEARYSNLGYLVLGEVIAAAPGTPFEDHVRQAMLAPAGMRHTGFAHHPGRTAATGYVRAPRVARCKRARRPPPPRHARDRAPVGLMRCSRSRDGASYGGLVGSVVDASRLARLHLGDGAIDGRGSSTRPLPAACAKSTRRADPSTSPRAGSATAAIAARPPPTSSTSAPAAASPT